MLKVPSIVAGVLFCFSIVQAQETAATCSTTSIYGRVTSSSSRLTLPQPWVVQVTARRIGGTAVFDKEESQGELFCVKVPLLSKVMLVFERDGFDPQDTDEIDTSRGRRKHSFALPVMKLDPISISGPAGALQEARPLRQEVRDRLNKHKEAVSATGSNDIFTWNLELYRNLYRDKPEVLREIDTFEAELRQQPKFLFLSTSEFEQKSKLFRFIIARSRGQSVDRDVRVADITALVTDSRVFSNIRSDALNILNSLDHTLSALERNQASLALMVTVEQDASAMLRSQAAKALAELGDRDALEILQKASVDDESPEVRDAAHNALVAITDRSPTHLVPSHTTVTKTVQNPDGTYTIIEYPAKKEVTINLTPVAVAGAKGLATVLRDDDGTRIKLNLTNIPVDVTAMTLYAVDDKGVVTALGPVAIENSTGELTVTTPLSRFMLVASPEPALTAYDANTRVIFRSAVPEGFTVIPVTGSASGERVAAVSAPTTGATVVSPTGQTATTYTAPLLGIANFKTGDDTKIKVDFTGALTGARANVFITPRKDGPTEVKMRFHELKDAPAGQKFIVWTVSPDGQFQKLGQVVNAKGRNEAEIRSETTLPDFGLVVTMENAEGVRPVGPAVAHIHIVP
jgi:hypothetical protein